MRFRQLDKIIELKAGAEITAARTLSEREEYFRDHFPEFPVMPGVLTLEAMFQACNWLVRSTDEFAHSAVVLKEAINIKFAGLVRPCQILKVSAAIKKHTANLTTLSAKADVNGATVASGRLVLERFNLADRYPRRAASDAFLRQKMRAEFDRLQAQSPANVPVVPSHYRWMWIDRFADFVAGRRAVALKTVSLTDEPLDLYLPGFPVMPCSLLIEGFAQTGGILVSACTQFEKRVVLAKASRAVFHRPAVPGETVVYTAEIESLQPEGAVVRGTSRIGNEPHAEVELFFAYVGDRVVAGDLIGPADILSTLRLFGLYDVARKPDGSPLEIPSRMLDAERAAIEGE
jgi:3-hydroxyacyl-[acyl-carrier-protein] dehydratase